MTNTREVVFRMRDHAAAQKLIADHKARYDAWREDLRKVFADHGLEGKNPLMETGLGNPRVTGAERVDPIPAGWKVKGKTRPDVIVPDKRLKAGREAAEILATLAQPDPRADLPGGMPFFCFGGVGLLTCGLRDMAGTVWVNWSGEAKAFEDVDPEVWERVKLSVYYAALEADEAAGGES